MSIDSTRDEFTRTVVRTHARRDELRR